MKRFLLLAVLAGSTYFSSFGLPSSTLGAPGGANGNSAPKAAPAPKAATPQAAAPKAATPQTAAPKAALPQQTAVLRTLAGVTIPTIPPNPIPPTPAKPATTGGVVAGGSTTPTRFNVGFGGGIPLPTIPTNPTQPTPTKPATPATTGGVVPGGSAKPTQINVGFGGSIPIPTIPPIPSPTKPATPPPPVTTPPPPVTTTPPPPITTPPPPTKTNPPAKNRPPVFIPIPVPVGGFGGGFGGRGIGGGPVVVGGSPGGVTFTETGTSPIAPIAAAPITAPVTAVPFQFERYLVLKNGTKERARFFVHVADRNGAWLNEQPVVVELEAGQSSAVALGDQPVTAAKARVWANTMSRSYTEYQANDLFLVNLDSRNQRRYPGSAIETFTYNLFDR